MQNEPRYYCRACYAHYTVTVQTLFHKTHTHLRKWYLLIALVMDSRKLPPVEVLLMLIGLSLLAADGTFLIGIESDA